MKKCLFPLLLVFITINVVCQNKVSLLPDNMIKYIGKVDRAGFEKLVGNPVGQEDALGVTFIVYEVVNTYGDIVTAIRCNYRDTDGKLIAVRFGTPHYLGYWINFSSLQGFNEKLNCKITKNSIGEIRWLVLKLKTFGCQIMDIAKVSPQITTAVINYHTVK